MGTKVAKFGGSSVAEGKQIEKIKKIVEADKDIKYIVVSAPGKRFDDDSKITDLLYLCKTHIEHKIPFEQIFQVIHDRYIAVEKELGVNVEMEQELTAIKEAIKEGAGVDYIVSRGEYLNARLIAAYLGFAFVDAKDIIRFSDKG
ncbi:MAG: aspartate kinase, partial [Eubacteriales bacterium]|nr:aspartate kinase [Eubacteriales bacterium]